MHGEINLGVLKCWRDKESRFENIAEAACKAFVLRALSVPAERTFSKSGMVTPQRQGLSDESLKATLFLNSWYLNLTECNLQCNKWLADQIFSLRCGQSVSRSKRFAASKTAYIQTVQKDGENNVSGFWSSTLQAVLFSEIFWAGDPPVISFSLGSVRSSLHTRTNGSIDWNKGTQKSD